MTPIKTEYNSYTVDFLEVGRYVHDGSMAIRAWSMQDGPIATITVCLDGQKHKPNESFVDTNNCPWAPEWIEENRLGRYAGRKARSGYCEYPLYSFDEVQLMNHIKTHG